MSEKILSQIEASAPRRVFGIATLLTMGALLIYLGLTLPADLLGRVFLLAVGGVALWASDGMRRATNSVVELREDGIYDGDGTLIAALSNIKSLDRGVFAFKPSTGFILRLTDPMPRVWRPGLWWRYGRRVGVGGVTAAHQAKAMAEIISALIHKED